MRLKLFRWITASLLALLFWAAWRWFDRFDDVYPEEGDWY